MLPEAVTFSRRSRGSDGFTETLRPRRPLCWVEGVLFLSLFRVCPVVQEGDWFFLILELVRGGGKRPFCLLQAKCPYADAPGFCAQ